MHYNFKHGQNRPIYHLNSFNLSIQRLFFHFCLFIHENLRTFCRSLRNAFQRLFRGSKLSRQIFLVLMVVTFHPFPGHALTSKTSNVVNGNVPYLTFDGGRTRAINTAGLLGITLSNGMRYTPSTNNSLNFPIVLPIVGQSFHFQRRISLGLFAGWGDVTSDSNVNFINHWYGTSDLYDSSKQSVFFVVSAVDGNWKRTTGGGTRLCVSS